MSYTTMAANASDTRFTVRVTACLAQEGSTDPTDDVRLVIWPIVTSSDVAAAYESAVIAGNPNPGGDPAVITDAMILSKVQANWPPTP